MTTARNALALSKCFAKTYIDGEKKKGGRCVLNHCHIVGEVARELISRQPIFLRETLFPFGSELIAATHDWGKVSPTFQEKIYRGCDGYMDNSIDELEGIDPDIEKNWGGHAGASMATAKAMNVGEFIPEILGQHHGYTPNLGGRLADDECFGGTSWQNRRREFYGELKKLLSCDFPKVNGSFHASVLSGLTTVSDWIGSGSFFDVPSQEWQPQISKVLDSAGFMRPDLKKDQSFENIFGFAPRPIQQTLIQCCNTQGVYVMEAPMGIGKTEAALYVAYRIMVKDRATGIYFALPTQLTSEKVLGRVVNFLGQILTDNCQHRDAFLLHGNAWLKQTQMGVEGQPGGSWFESTKRKILAPFGVGTIDQALMAVMNVKHGFVRTFGLAGKVVILDEVHSYDVYTGTLLKVLVSALRQLQCTVIILSATLSTDKRRELLGVAPKKHGYPLVSVFPLDCDLQEIEFMVPTNDTVHLSWVKQREAIDEALQRAGEGQQVLWVENSVTEAQDIYSLLAARTHEMNIRCGLLHSRFTKTDRDRIEQYWVELFGKGCVKERNDQGRILVGTQVLEQSLDIDADFIITRFCPTDMLLQRLGRLWRHSERSRPPEAKRDAWIIAPQLGAAIENPEKAFGNTAFVYNPYVLCRSLKVWHEKRDVSIPRDIRGLIEDTYQERDEQDQMATWKHELINGNQRKHRVGTKAMKSMAQIGISRVGTTLPENKATTRYSEQESVQVLLLRNIQFHPEGGVELTLLEGDNTLILPTKIKAKDKNRWRELAVCIMQQIVTVVQHHAPAVVPRKSIDWLSDYLYLGNKDYDESLVRVALVEESGELKLPGGEPVSGKFDIKYNSNIGYQVIKRSQSDNEQAV